jgi:hypothetical protein
MMSKFKFVCEETDIRNEPNGNKITSEFQAESLGDLLSHIENFLKGSGFVFNGVLDFVQEDTSMEEQLDEEESDTSSDNWIHRDGQYAYQR